MVNHMNKLWLTVPMFAATLVLAETASQAFTFENSGTSTGSGSAIAHPDEQVKKFGSGATTNQGGLHFGVGAASGSGLTNRSNSPPAWVGNPLFLDKGSSQSNQ